MGVHSASFLNLTQICLTVMFLFCRFSHLHAGGGWTGVSAVNNGGMVEPGQGVNGTMLTNQAGMSAAGYHTHWSQKPFLSLWGHKNDTLLGGKECIRCALSVTTHKLFCQWGWYTILSTLLAHTLIHCPNLQVWRKTIHPSTLEHCWNSRC